MTEPYSHCLRTMERWYPVLERTVPPPKKVPYLNHFVFRYEERTLEQALVLKLARVVTGLHSARILIEHGFLQEQAAIHRMLDEFQQDITFLSMAPLTKDFTPLHQEYLDSFYQEEFDKPEDPVASTQKRSMVPRRKILAYLSRKEAEIGVENPSRGQELTRTLSKAYSGFVHGAATQILNMYGGDPPRFHISGMIGTSYQLDHCRDHWNYLYRGIMSFNEVALVLEQSTIAEESYRYAVEFQRSAGKNYFPPEQKET